jgi:hypothetical protein
LPAGALLRVYSLEEIAVEKTVALLDRARNEPRDLYDLWFLMANGHVLLPDLVESIERKLEFRGLTLARAGKEFGAKEARYRKLWQVRLEAQMVDLPDFDRVHRAVKRAFRQAGIAPR